MTTAAANFDCADIYQPFDRMGIARMIERAGEAAKLRFRSTSTCSGTARATNSPTEAWIRGVCSISWGTLDRQYGTLQRDFSGAVQGPLAIAAERLRKAGLPECPQGIHVHVGNEGNSGSDVLNVSFVEGDIVVTRRAYPPGECDPSSAWTRSITIAASPGFMQVGPKTTMPSRTRE